MLNYDTIKKLALQGKIAFKKHALVRIIERHISVHSIIVALENCEIIKEYPDDKPLPSCLILGYNGNKPIHLVVAVENLEMLWIITAYTPDKKMWNDDFKAKRGGV